VPDGIDDDEDAPIEAAPGEPPDGAAADDAANGGIYTDKTINRQSINAAIGFFIPSS